MNWSIIRVNQAEIIQTILVIIVVIIIRLILQKVVKKRITLLKFSENRRVITLRAVSISLLVVAIIAVTSIWSLDPAEIVFFVSSIVTVLGVAFFAQWSHLSNITAGIIIFFNSSTKIGDTITILDKDFNISGEIMAIETLFIKIITEDGEIISIPNNILIQKPIRIKVGRKIHTS